MPHVQRLRCAVGEVVVEPDESAVLSGPAPQAGVHTCRARPTTAWVVAGGRVVARVEWAHSGHAGGAAPEDLVGQRNYRLRRGRLTSCRTVWTPAAGSTWSLRRGVSRRRRDCATAVWSGVHLILSSDAPELAGAIRTADPPPHLSSSSRSTRHEFAIAR